MAPLVIEGETLGEIHHKYNKLVNDAIKKKNVQLTDINYDDSDFDNLFKIDIASTNRNVEYILKVLQCTDMLYVSRAIKKSPWLITDKQYAHVINPEYLFNELRFHMTSKAFNKLILKIRLLLRDERVEDFYNYYKEKDLQTALKWLPRCSQSFVENVLEKHANDKELTNNLLKRLCEKSMKFLYIYCYCNKEYHKNKALFETTFMTNIVMKDDVERYLDILETMSDYIPKLTAKTTKIIMTKCRNRFMENFARYTDNIDVPSFAKFLSEAEIKDFMLRKIQNTWFDDPDIIFLMSKVPSEGHFEFIKETFTIDDAVRRYNCYIHAPFETAFRDLNTPISTESNPKERINMLTVLFTAAGHNIQNIHTLLKYYRENHINEPFIFKNEFINMVLSKTKTYRYDKSTWNYLKDIFSSMEVFSKSDKDVQSCVRSVLLYCVINDEPVPEIIEKKIEFETLKQYKTNLPEDEQNKIFNYLLKSICSKIQNDKSQTEKEFKVVFGILENALNLLCDWDKDLKDYPTILNKIKQIIEIKKENPAWEMDIRILYNKKKSWKKLLFAESLLVSPAQDTVMNALKHDIRLIETYKHKIDELLKDNKNLDIFFQKIRIYCSQSLANSFKEMLISNLHQNYNHKPYIRGLCSLLPPKEVTEIIKKYVPSDPKIDWSQHDEVQLYIRKYLAMNLYLARPQPSLDMALLYAKGDYLQYALSSLNAILYNMSTDNVRENLKPLINSPVSLQKHGIRAAILKLKREDLKLILSDKWKSLNNIMRADIFIYNYNMLCEKKYEQSIKDQWELIKMIIDNLTPNEHKRVYTTLSEVEKVPMSIKKEYWMKIYEFFNSLPTKSNSGRLLDHLVINMANIMLDLDDDFVAKIFMTSFDEQFCTQDYTNALYVATFLLTAKTEEAQMKLYNKILVPMFEKSFPLWDKEHEGVHHVRNNIAKIIKCLADRFDIVLREDMVFPIKMFIEILETLQKNLTETENYILITIQKIGLKYIRIMDKILHTKEMRFPIATPDDLVYYLHSYAATYLGNACMELLKEDVANNFSSIYIPFAEALKNVLSLYGKNNLQNNLRVVCGILRDEEFIEGYLLALEVLPENVHTDRQHLLKNDLLYKIGKNPNMEIKMHYSALLNRTEKK